MPSDLQRDLERDRSIKTWPETWNFILEQVQLRKEWKPKKNDDAMDVDHLGEEKEETKGKANLPEMTKVKERTKAWNMPEGKVDALSGKGTVQKW